MTGHVSSAKDIIMMHPIYRIVFQGGIAMAITWKGKILAFLDYIKVKVTECSSVS